MYGCGSKKIQFLLRIVYRNELINMIEVWNVRLMYKLMAEGKQSNKWRENESRIESKYTISLMWFGARMTKNRN